MDSDYRHNQPSYKSSIIKALSLSAMVMMEAVSGAGFWAGSLCIAEGFNSHDTSCDSTTCTSFSWNPTENNFACKRDDISKDFNMIWVDVSGFSNSCLYQKILENVYYWETGSNEMIAFDFFSFDSSCDQNTCITADFATVPIQSGFSCTGVTPAPTPATPGFHWVKDIDGTDKCFYSNGSATTYTIGKNQYQFKSSSVGQSECTNTFFNGFVPTSNVFPIKPIQNVYWDSTSNKCYFFNGIKLSNDAIVKISSIDNGYTYFSTLNTCTSTTCTTANLSTAPTQSGFSCPAVTPTPTPATPGFHW
jgi:hypothetical protein